MEPGRRMTVTVELTERAGELATLKGKGEADGQQTVSARVVLASYSLKERNPALAAQDEALIQHWRSRFAWLCQAGASAVPAPK